MDRYRAVRRFAPQVLSYPMKKNSGGNPLEPCGACSEWLKKIAEVDRPPPVRHRRPATVVRFERNDMRPMRPQNHSAEPRGRAGGRAGGRMLLRRRIVERRCAVLALRATARARLMRRCGTATHCEYAHR